MSEFHLRQRIVMKDTHPLAGWRGYVVSIQLDTGNAWVEMDDDIPGNFRQSKHLHDSRRNWLQVRPQDCEELAT